MKVTRTNDLWIYMNDEDQEVATVSLHEGDQNDVQYLHPCTERIIDFLSENPPPCSAGSQAIVSREIVATHHHHLTPKYHAKSGHITQVKMETKVAIKNRNRDRYVPYFYPIFLCEFDDSNLDALWLPLEMIALLD